MDGKNAIGQPIIAWEVLKATWDGLTACADQYVSMSQPWCSLIEARRLVECEMRAQGYDKEWRSLRER